MTLHLQVRLVVCTDKHFFPSALRPNSGRTYILLMIISNCSMLVNVVVVLLTYIIE
jgi:hypothetical protein